LADDAVSQPANPPAKPSKAFGSVYDFSEVFDEEIALINPRRREDPRGEIRLEVEAEQGASGERVMRPPLAASLVGLALSGGGIRSAAFCLGVLQALDKVKVLERVDYLSTVSGGGYIGCSLTASLEQAKAPGWAFPFASDLKEDEPPALQHIRDYSNYLFPRRSALLRNASIYARGLAVNVVLVAPFVLFASAATLFFYWLRALTASWQLGRFFNVFGLPLFSVTVDFALLIFAVGIIWGLYRSAKLSAPEIPSGPTGRVVGALVILLFAIAFCELQPVLLGSMIKHKTGNLLAIMPWPIQAITAALTPVATAMTFLASKIGEFIKSTGQSTGSKKQIAGVVTRILIYVAGLIVPLAIWMIYLGVTYWGLCADGLAGGKPTPWQPATLGFLAATALCVVLTIFMRPNANSLHPLYRDRLAKAFLFVPQPTLRPDEMLEPCRPLLSGISGCKGPYHLINTALNVEASKTANRRGRNADFFFFSPRFVGSKSTGYVRTTDLETQAIGLDLATAMAVSGAAVSSNMGAQSIRPLTASMALLNVRLGYWLRNPHWLQLAGQPGATGVAEFKRTRNPFANYYFLAEMFGLLSDQFTSVYLTDGGHIENLGIYELLRRRCRVIIAVDAEADPEMAFGSFNMLERYALIDMGIRIDLPWQKIADETRATSDAIAAKADAPKHKGPHCAIGEICYPDDRKGILVYIKASLTGDENDYIFDYKRRYGDFPHETTLDQMFTEEQFEAYRALGFHAAYRLFCGVDDVACLDTEDGAKGREQVKFLNELFGVTESV
jgi:Patatin-like phospholipase